jgi:hypothetical protein
MKRLEFLGNLAKQLALASTKPWLFQGSRKMEPNATPDFLENRSAVLSYIV